MKFDQLANLKCKLREQAFFCIGIGADTVGRNKKAIKKYIANQLQENQNSKTIEYESVHRPVHG